MTESAFSILSKIPFQFEVFNHIAKALNCFIRLSECHPYLINWSIIRNSYLLTNLHKSNSITLPIFFPLSLSLSLPVPTAVKWNISLLIRWHSFEGNSRYFSMVSVNLISVYFIKSFHSFLFHSPNHFFFDDDTNFSDTQVAFSSVFCCFIIAMRKCSVLVAQHKSHFSSTWQFFICLVFFYLFFCFNASTHLD